MTWYVRYFNDRKGLAKLDHDYPYLSSLLLTPADQAGWCGERLRNYLAAVRAERDQPIDISYDPYHVVLDPSDLCQLSCPLCVQSTNPKDRSRQVLKMSLARAVLDQLKRALIRVDLFSWGEPLLNPAFSTIAQLFNDAGIYTRTSTHLSFPKGIDAGQIVRSGIRYVAVSIDGATQDTYMQYRGGGDLSVVLRNAETLVRVRERLGSPYPILDWQYLVFRHNEHEIGQAQALARSIGFDVFRYGGGRARLADRITEPSKTNFVNSKSILINGESDYSEYDTQGNPKNSEEQSRCRWLWGKIAVHADGGVAPCWTAWQRSHDLGSLNQNSIPDLWRSDQYRQARQLATTGGGQRDSPACARCALNRAFVNPPDPGDVNLSPHDMDSCCETLQNAGLSVSLEIKETLRQVLIEDTPHMSLQRDKISQLNKYDRL